MSKKAIVIIGIAFFLGIVLLSYLFINKDQNKTDAAIPKKWMEYKNENFGYTIKHPPDMRVIEGQKNSDIADRTLFGYHMFLGVGTVDLFNCTGCPKFLEITNLKINGQQVKKSTQFKQYPERGFQIYQYKKGNQYYNFIYKQTDDSKVDTDIEKYNKMAQTFKFSK